LTELYLNSADELPQPHLRPYSNVKIPFVWAFHYLKSGLEFEEIMREIVTKGGDTQSNAAVVGGLLGAAKDINNLPK
jgi:ADP-ribosyl-[dinitrogen reductase] hydrolase